MTRFKTCIRTMVMLVIVLFPCVSSARIGIRDTEIERTLDMFTAPLIVAARLDPASISVNVLNLWDINAFVAEGQNIFLHAGLIVKVQSPDQLISVIAHEMGHITGGHLVKRKDAEEKAFITSLISTLLIGGASLGASQGDPSGAIGGLLGGQMTGLGQMLAYSRSQESAADQAALTFLEKAHLSPQGMLTMLSSLQKETGEKIIKMPYATTHPLSQERIALLEERAQKSSYWNIPISSDWMRSFKRMQGKLKGFLQDPEEVLRQYPLNNTSVEARYARAAAYHRLARHEESFQEMDALVKESPSDPYFYELRGQFFMETGQVDAALKDYRNAYKRSGDAPLIAAALGGALVQQETRQSLLEAVGLLKRALLDDPSFDSGWHSLAIAYDRLGQGGEAALASAEMFSVQNNPKDAITQARRAKTLLSPTSVSWRKAHEIEDAMTLELKNTPEKFEDHPR
jgi:predicted Zn-dependent protease